MKHIEKFLLVVGIEILLLLLGLDFCERMPNDNGRWLDVVCTHTANFIVKNRHKRVDNLVKKLDGFEDTLDAS